MKVTREQQDSKKCIPRGSRKITRLSSMESQPKKVVVVVVVVFVVVVVVFVLIISVGSKFGQ